MKHLYICTFLLLSVTLLHSKPNNSIITSSGIVEGFSKNKVVIYEDIPYAKPPVDNLRWQAPQKINTPVNIYPKKNNFCVQRPSNLGGFSSESSFVGSEDCLYLDIFVPKKSLSKNLPVMFWIHGGGNTSGLKDLYDFSKMVRKEEIIFIRINYRLGPFGFFTHPSIQNYQNGDNKTSNFGTLDIIMALKWVQDNISKFGGDPNNVTIFGESAGGHNVLSLLVAKKADGLFHKAISMSGYTTSISKKDAYKPDRSMSTSNFSSWNIVNNVLNEKLGVIDQSQIEINKIREILLGLSTEDFFKFYIDRASYEELPLLTSDGIVIPEIGLREALSKPKYLNNVPTIAGSNRDEVKLWLGTAEYFVDLNFSFLGSMLNIPSVKINREDAFEAFNFYRSSAWKIRGVDDPLKSMIKAGNKSLYAYRFDWDDHRRLVVADFKKLIGASHASEIPLLAGNAKLVGGYPLSDLIYPPSFSKRYLSKNMIKFWANFAKNGAPGKSSNNILWKPYKEKDYQYIILDKKNNLNMSNDNLSFSNLSKKLFEDKRVTDIEKCVILFQMFTFVGDDLYEDNIRNYPNDCNRETSEKFIIDNASFIEY